MILGFTLALGWTSWAYAQTEERVARLGVLAHRGPDAAVDYWLPLSGYLGSSIDGWQFEIKPVTLISAAEKIASREIDFLVTNPGHFVTLAEEFPVSAIATRERVVDAKPTGLLTYGTAIIARRGSGIRAISDLRNKRVAAVSRDAFGGFQIAWSEMLENDVNVFSDLGSLRFMGFPQDAIVNAVASGEVDAGIVRSGLLESLEAEGRIRSADFVVLNSRSQPDYPFRLTGHVFPEWPFVSVPGVDKELTEAVARALLETQDPAVQQRFGLRDAWSAPASYTMVRRLVGKYQALGQNPPGRLDWPLYALVAAAFAVLLLSVGVILYGLRKLRPREVAGSPAAPVHDPGSDVPLLTSAREKFQNLTSRELEVLSLICAGRPSKAIAFELGVSPKTVEFHRSNLLKKTEAGSTAHLVQLATRLGFDLGVSRGETQG